MSTHDENDVDNDDLPASSQSSLDNAMAALLRASRPGDRLPGSNPFDAVRAAHAAASAAAAAESASAPAASPFAQPTSSASPSASQDLFAEYHSTNSAADYQTAPSAAAAATVAAPAPAVAEPESEPEPEAEVEAEPETPAPSAVATAEAPSATSSSVPASEPSPMTQQAVASISIMEEGGSADQYLVDASKYISEWLADNIDNEEVIQAAMEWARKHSTAEHNGQVIASLFLADEIDADLTLIAVRWITKYTNHPLAKDIVAGLKATRE